MLYKVYFKLSTNFFRVYDGSNITTEKYIPNDTSVFYLTKKGNYEATDASLIQYHADIKAASDELKQSEEFRGFDYIKPFVMKDGSLFCRSHCRNIKTMFSMKAPKGWDKHPPIDIIEAQWFNSSYNAGLQYVDKGDHTSYGYDFNILYPRILGDRRFSEFKIPVKNGQEYILQELPTELQYGFYKINIECDDPNIKKVFSFSQDNVYTHFSVAFLLELNKKHGFKINIQLVQDGQPNAYLYNQDDIIDSKDIFNGWFGCILNLKKKYPKNILVKMISSSLWGHLSQKNTISVPEDKIDNYDCSFDNDADYKIIDVITTEDGSEYYKLLDIKKPYKTNLRLKPFITSYGRNKTARIALRMIDNVIRIHTDGVCFNQEYKIKSECLLPEDKTTGHLRFNNINNYQRL